VGAGKPALQTGDRLALDLQEHLSFGNGTVYLRYDLEGRL